MEMATYPGWDFAEFSRRYGEVRWPVVRAKTPLSGIPRDTIALEIERGGVIFGGYTLGGHDEAKAAESRLLDHICADN
jgi:hypothetical protein